MMSIPLQEVLNWAEGHTYRLKHSDPRWKGFVFLKHEDGSVFEWNHAFLMRKKIKKFPTNWVVIFTEHHGQFAYDPDDITSIYASKKPRREDDGLSVPNAVMKRGRHG